MTKKNERSSRQRLTIEKNNNSYFRFHFLLSFQSKSIDDIRLTFIKSKLQELTRDKSKYNMEKLTQDLEFLQREMGHLSHSIADLNREIIHQISLKKNLVNKFIMGRFCFKGEIFHRCLECQNGHSSIQFWISLSHFGNCTSS